MTDTPESVLSPWGDALFWPPAATAPGAAGYEHVPLCQWIVAAGRPVTIASLAAATHAQFLAFAEAALRTDLPATCLAVDSPNGIEALRRLAGRYAGHARWVGTGDLHAGSLDLLHVPASMLTPALVARLGAWLSEAGILVLDLVGDARGAADALASGRPSFRCLHGGGLLVVAMGAAAPAAVLRLCAADAATTAALRTRFATIGTGWAARIAAIPDDVPGRQQLHAAVAHAVAADVEIAGLRRQLQRIGRESADAVAAATGRAERAEHHAAAQARWHAHEASMLRDEFASVTGSASWRLAQALRHASSLGRATPIVARYLSGPAAPEPTGEPQPELTVVIDDRPPLVPPLADPQRPRVLFVAGEPNTPGASYRCTRLAAAARDAGWEATCKRVELVGPDDLPGTDVVILWRTAYSQHVATMIEVAHHHGARVGLDLDDLMVRPELARGRYIDAIRSLGWSEARITAMFEGIAVVMGEVDFCVATTEELAADMRSTQRAGYVVPNGFDDATLRASRLAFRRGPPGDGLVRLGYASGSRTHQRDFAAAVDAIAAVLHERPLTRLVLFQSSDGRSVLIADEFPQLAPVAGQIEWRDLVALDALPDELARFDINLVPLETGNPFVEAKSELKHFEAALAGCCSVASPTGPYRRAIVDGVTGFLCDDTESWRRTLLRLVDDPALRARLARDAFHDVLWRHGPQLRSATLGMMLAQQRAVSGKPADGPAAFARHIARADAAAIPAVAPTVTLFAHDALHEAAVTVVVASYNYAEYVLQALDSVRQQSVEAIDLVVVDDCSTDPLTVPLILDWARLHATRFNRLLVLRHVANGGLGATRNAAIAAAETPYVLPLDADNRLRPDCVERLLAEINDAAFAYPKLQGFGGADRVFGAEPWEPQRLVGGNYIDAMAMVAKWAWAACGGYYVRRDAMGWEDYALWCRMAELGLHGVPVPDVLAEYRLHADSMVNSITETQDTKHALVAFIEQRHPWLRILARDPRLRR